MLNVNATNVNFLRKLQKQNHIQGLNVGGKRVTEEREFIKFEKIKHLGIEGNEEIFKTGELVVIQTKVDGSQANFWKDQNGILHIGRHRAELTKEEMDEKKRTGRIKWKAIPSIKEAFKYHKSIMNPDWIYFGESMQSHKVRYHHVPDFVGYDILDTKTREFLPWRDARREFIFLGLPFVHVYCEKPGKKLNLERLKALCKDSVYGEEESEGVVLKCDALRNRYGRAMRAKIVNPKFIEDKGKRKERPAEDKKDEIEITERYATESRIFKKIKELEDEGEEISLEAMRKLPTLVTEDILVEQISQIYHDYKKVNFKILRSLVAKRCLRELREYLESKTLL